MADLGARIMSHDEIRSKVPVCRMVRVSVMDDLCTGDDDVGGRDEDREQRQVYDAERQRCTCSSTRHCMQPSRVGYYVLHLRDVPLKELAKICPRALSVTEDDKRRRLLKF